MVKYMENKVRFRNHPILIIKGLGGFVVFLVVIIFQNIKEIMKSKDKIAEVTRGTGTMLFVLLFVLVVFLIDLIIQYTKWKNKQIIIDEENIYYEYKGFFKRIKKQVSFKNVSNVNIKTTIFDNVFAVRQIQLDINSSETADNSEYKILLSACEADKFINMIETSRHGNIKTKSDVQINVSDEMNSQQTEHEYLDKESMHMAEDTGFAEYSFTKFECLRHVLLKVSVYSLLWFVGVIIFSYSQSFKDETHNFVEMIVAVSIGAGPLILEFAKDVMRYMNFKVLRSGDTISISYGFLSTQSYIIPVKNIVSVGVTQSFIAKLSGYKCIEINTIGIGNEGGESSALCVYMKNDDIGVFAEKVIPEFNIVHDFVMQPSKILFYNSIVNSVILEIICVCFAYSLGYCWIMIFGIPIGIILAYINYNSKGMKLANDYIIIKKGYLSTKTQTIYFDHVDQISIKQNIFQKAINLEKFEMKSRGKNGSEINNTGYYKTGTFDEIMEQMLCLRSF